MTRVKRGWPPIAATRRSWSWPRAIGRAHRKLFKTANEAVMRALSYAYRHRRERKRDFRRLWTVRINAAARLNGLTTASSSMG